MNDTDGRNRRRSQRVLLQIAVLISAEMPDGNHVRTQAFTRVVNAHGGLFEAPFRMTAGQRIKLRNPQTHEEVACRIVRVDTSADGHFPTAFEFDAPTPRFWPISFPPSDWSATEELTTESQ